VVAAATNPRCSASDAPIGMTRASVARSNP
jgi:hypothetical protein